MLRLHIGILMRLLVAEPRCSVGAWERAGAAESEWSQVEINQLLFADDTALVDDSEEKLCRLVSEYGRVYAKEEY